MLEKDAGDELDRWCKKYRSVTHTIKRRKAKWIGHILRCNCLLKHTCTIEGGIEVREDEEEGVCSYWMTLKNLKTGSTRLYYMENSLWKRLWTCCKRGY